MANGKTFTVTEQLNSEEDYDALQEVTAELEQAEARIEELEAKLAAKEKLMLTLAGDKIDLMSELVGVKGKLAGAVKLAEKDGYYSWGQYGHWYAHIKVGGTEYAPANHIEQLTATNKELEAKLVKVTEELEEYKWMYEDLCK